MITRRLNLNILLTTVTLFLIAGCGGGDSSKYSTNNVETPTKNIIDVYDKDSKYSEVIVGCVAKSTYNAGCSLDTLPIIALSSTSSDARSLKRVSDFTPTKEQILERLVVSDKWMGDNFSIMLDHLPEDIKKLFGAVTAIVISKDIIPSYYSPSTGAIYLDPRYFWFTPEEAKTILEKEDYRSNYGKSLQFIPAWRYIKENDYAYKSYSIDSGKTRTPEDIKLSLARLLYHELAHANDFVANIDKADKNKKIGDALEEFIDQSPSALLNDKYPLKDADLKSLAGVLYRGDPSTERLNALTSADVGKKFESDGADDLYGFNNRFEDFAMLFEATMMKKNFQVERDVAFLSKDSSYTVGWGERNRIASESVKERAKFVANQLLPSDEWDQFFDSDVGSLQKLNNVGWFDSVDINSSETQRRLKTLSSGVKIMDFKSPEY
jgi:hypothetical protein